MELRPYQIEGAKFLASRKRALLADEMGLGKSAQAILAASHFAPGCDGVVVGVVCPASVRDNWTREFGRFWPYDASTTIRLCVESYEKVVRGAWDGAQFDVLILDEAHYLKSRTAKRTKVILGDKCDGVGGLIERAKFVFALTGTPTPNHSGELYPALRALAPEIIANKSGRPMTYWQFVDRYCKTVDNGFGIQIVGNRNTPELKSRISEFVLRRKKDDVATDIPPITFDTLPLSHKAAAKALAEAESDAWVREIREALKGGAEGLKGLAPHVASLRRLTGMAKAPAVIEWIEDWLEAGGEKLVVFAHHKEVIAYIYGAFGPEACRIFGETPVDKRQAAVDAFQNDPAKKLFIGQIQAAGTGITLTAASEVLFAESSWVPAENQQAAMRVHRIGQKNACLVRFATLTGSLDEQIQQTVARKTAEIAQLFD